MPAIARAGRAVTAERVEQVALPALVEQPLLVVLPVDLDQRPDLVGEPRGGRGLIVEPGGRAAAGRDLANRDERLRQAVEQRLHAGRLRAVADEPDVRARAADEPERVDEQALAGSGLAGDDVEARREGQAQAIDQREVADGQLEEASAQSHDGSSATLWRSRSQNGCAPAGSTRRIGRSQRPDLDDVADRERHVLAAVDRDERLVGVDDRAADDLAGARRRPTGWPTGRPRSA